MKSKELKPKRLLDMKEKLDTITLDLARLGGMEEELTKRLKSKSGYNTPSKAKSVLKKLDKRIESKQQELEDGIEKLEEDYEW